MSLTRFEDSARVGKIKRIFNIQATTWLACSRHGTEAPKHYLPMPFCSAMHWISVWLQNHDHQNPWIYWIPQVHKDQKIIELLISHICIGGTAHK